VRSHSKDMIEYIDPNTYFNDVLVNFDPVLFDVLNATRDAVGDMTFMPIGLPVGTRPGAPSDHILELVTDAERLLGNRLDAISLGNGLVCKKASSSSLPSKKLFSFFRINSLCT
jgi:hypothetical protein